MKILFVNAGSYINRDMMEAVSGLIKDAELSELAYFFGDENVHHNDKFEEAFLKKTQNEGYEFVISTNFYPIIARLCHDLDTPYIAWSFDSPIEPPCDEMKYETNYIFLYDRAEAVRYRGLGFERFYHLPLAVNTFKYDGFKASSEYKGDVAFMCKLYRSKYLGMVREGLSREMYSYVDKLIDVQRRNIGKYVIDELISQPIIDEMNRQYSAAGRSFQINREQLEFTVAEYVTYLDRLILLEMMARRFDTHLYTWNITDGEKSVLANVKIHNKLDYFSTMPVMFKSCKINLSGSFRSARSGIPLRSLDIMGCRGFLLSPAQQELEENFKDREEVVIYHSEQEAVELADYYLKHDDERQKIANAGYERVKKEFRYEDRLRKMFETAGIHI